MGLGLEVTRYRWQLPVDKGGPPLVVSVRYTFVVHPQVEVIDLFEVVCSTEGVLLGKGTILSANNVRLRKVLFRGILHPPHKLDEAVFAWHIHKGAFGFIVGNRRQKHCTAFHHRLI